MKLTHIKEIHAPQFGKCWADQESFCDFYEWLLDLGEASALHYLESTSLKEIYRDYRCKLESRKAYDLDLEDFPQQVAFAHDYLMEKKNFAS